MLSVGVTLSNFDRKQKKRKLAKEDISDCFTEALRTLPIVAELETGISFSLGDFSKKAENHLKKLGNLKKKSGILPKSRRLTSLFEYLNILTYV